MSSDLSEPRPAHRHDELRFFLQWLRRPGRIGAVVPSGSALAAALAEQVDTVAPGPVVELGPGTGSVTAALLASGVPKDRLVAVEREAAFCGILAERFPGLRVIQGDARELHRLLDRAGTGPAAAVVSSLPLVGFSVADQRRILSQAFEVLGPEGALIQYTYGLWPPVPAALRGELGIDGTRVGRILANLPPASIWRYRRSARQGPLSEAA